MGANWHESTSIDEDCEHPWALASHPLFGFRIHFGSLFRGGEPEDAECYGSAEDEGGEQYFFVHEFDLGSVRQEVCQGWWGEEGSEVCPL